MKISAIKPGPKPKTEEGDLDKRRRVSPPNVPKYNPPLKPHKPKNKKKGKVVFVLLITASENIKTRV